MHKREVCMNFKEYFYKNMFTMSYKRKLLLFIVYHNTRSFGEVAIFKLITTAQIIIYMLEILTEVFLTDALVSAIL